MKHSVLIRFRKITEIATLAQDTCLTVKTFCQAHVPHVSGVHLSMPPGIPNTKQDESVHVGFSDRGEADASKGRFISPLGTWHRFPFDGELFSNTVRRRLALPAPPSSSAGSPCLGGSTADMCGPHFHPYQSVSAKEKGRQSGFCVCVFFRSYRWFQLLNLFV